MAPPKNCWPTDCDVLYDQAKGELILDPSKPIPPHLGPKYLHFESRVIAHIIGTTLLPRAGSHSTLTQHDPLFGYCLVSCIKCYNSRAFQSMDFIHSGSSWILKVNSEDLGDKHEKGKTSSSTSVSTAKLNVALENMDAMQAKLDVVSISVSQVVDVMTKLATMGGQVDSLKDLLLVAHYKIYNVKDVSKEIGADVARICLRLDQIVKEAIKIATKVQPVSKAISTSLSSKFEEMSTAIVNTLTYFLRPR
ncbi:hypothetical protein KY285_001228 [Solanum tuberosum]|nr:hypothetical protein KY285_001228 [Solanum tuberosum]